MANPQYPVNLIGGQWNKVATGVTSGKIYRKTLGCDHYQTYRLNGDPAPTTIDEGVLIFDKTYLEPIGASSAIDVYIWSTKDAVLRVDI